jgi:predicted PurR-regulated permease PerM
VKSFAEGERSDHEVRAAISRFVPYSNTAFVRMLLDHPARTAAAIGTCVVIYKLLVAAQFNTTIALALASTGNPPAMLLGVAVASLPAVVVPSLLGSGCADLVGRRHARRPISRSLVFLFVVGSFALATISFELVATMFGLLVLLIVIDPVVQRLERRLERPDASQDAVVRNSDALFVLMAGLFTVFMLAVPGVWLPREVVTFGSVSTSGYVINVSDGWVAFLTDHERLLVYHPMSEMTSRKLCEQGSRTLPELLGRGAVLPACP